MKRMLVLLTLINLCQGSFSLEIAYIKEIEVRSVSVEFCDNAQNIVIHDSVINVQNGTLTNFSSGDRDVNQINRFVYIRYSDKFGRDRLTLFSFVHGKKIISNEVFESLRGNNYWSDPTTSDVWDRPLYGNSEIRCRLFIPQPWEWFLYNIEFFSNETKIIDVPIEMKYGLQDNPSFGTSVSYDLFTGVFSETWKDEDPEDNEVIKTGKLHIFNLIYDGTLTSKTEIRETPSHDGKILGYLNEGESVKVSKAENYEKREGYQDYWYYVTTDLYSGWCTGEFLLIDGDTWLDRLELRGPYVEWDDIPESEDITKKPLYGLITTDTNLYELPDEHSMRLDEGLELLENYPINGSAIKGSVVEVVDRDYYRSVSGVGNEWYKIRLENGIEGWIQRNDIEVDRYGTKNLDTTGIPDEIIEIEIVDPENSEIHGVMNDTRVRLRRAPNLNSETLEYLNTGDEVIIIEKTTEKQQIGDMEDYWYKVNKVKEGGYPTGWVYGAFVDFAVEEVAVIEDTEDIPDITVDTDEKNTAIPWVIGGAILLLGAIIGAVIIVKKKKS